MDSGRDAVLLCTLYHTSRLLWLYHCSCSLVLHLVHSSCWHRSRSCSCLSPQIAIAIIWVFCLPCFKSHRAPGCVSGVHLYDISLGALIAMLHATCSCKDSRSCQTKTAVADNHDLLYSYMRLCGMTQHTDTNCSAASQITPSSPYVLFTISNRHRQIDSPTQRDKESANPCHFLGTCCGQAGMCGVCHCIFWHRKQRVADCTASSSVTGELVDPATFFAIRIYQDRQDVAVSTDV